MGNSIQPEPIQFYNTTSYTLRISIDHRRFINDPQISRITNVDQVSSDHLFVDIDSFLDSRLDCLVAQASFFAGRNQSWIISDTEVRRRLPGAPAYVADDWTTETSIDRKRSVWRRAIPDERIYDFPKVRDDAQYFRPSGDGTRRTSAETSLTIFNDSSHYLDICVEYQRAWRSTPEKSKLMYFQSNPRKPEHRMVLVDAGGDRYPLVRVVAVRPRIATDDDDQLCKAVEMYAKNGSSWIVTDECITRQAGTRRPPYVAAVYGQSETAETGRTKADKWTNADRVNRYEWEPITVQELQARLTLQQLSVDQYVKQLADAKPEWVEIDLSQAPSRGAAVSGVAGLAVHGDPTKMAQAAAEGTAETDAAVPRTADRSASVKTGDVAIGALP